MNAFMKLAAPVALLALAACAKDTTRPDDSGTSGTTPDSSSTTPYSGPSAGSTGITSGAAPAAAMPTGRVIHFAFDSSEISGEGQTVVEGWAAYLSANPGAKVRLEGHCDERGTREYNVALGERRGNAVLQALAARGVAERQVSVTSFGEERPVADGHDEAARTQNRRVEVVM